MNKSDQAVMGARAALISGREIQRLIMAAKRAHQEQVRCGLADDDFSEWRHAALWDAIKVKSFRDVSQHKLGEALRYFRALAGDENNERTVWQRKNARIVKREESGESDRAKALYVLKLECQRSADVFGGYQQAEAYAGYLLVHAHKLPEGEEWRTAHAKQLWQVTFTMRNRAAAKRKKMRAAEAEESASAPAELGGEA